MNDNDMFLQHAIPAEHLLADQLIIETPNLTKSSSIIPLKAFLYEYVNGEDANRTV